MITTSNQITFNERYPSLDAKPVEHYHLLPDLFKIVCGNMDIKTLGRVSMVSRHWHLMSSDDSVWKCFEGEFKVQAPNIKLKIWLAKTTLERIYHEIINKMDSEVSCKRNTKHANFFLNFVKILFEGNVKLIQVSDDLKKTKFTITLNKTRKIFFRGLNLWNIQIPTLVCLKFTNYGQLKFCKTDSGITDIGINVFGPRNSYCKRIQISDFDEVAIVSRLKKVIFLSEHSWVYIKPKNLDTFSNSVLYTKEWV